MNECLHFHHKTAIFPISSIAIIHDEISTVPPRRKLCRKDFLDFKGPAQAMKTGIKQKSTSRRIPEISRAPTKSEGQAQATSSGGTRVRASGFNLFLSDSIESCFVRSAACHKSSSVIVAQHMSHACLQNMKLSRGLGQKQR